MSQHLVQPGDRKVSQPDHAEGPNITAIDDSRTYTTYSVATIDPYISPKRSNTYSSPQAKVKRGGQEVVNTSFNKNLASTAAKKSSARPASSKVSPFFRKGYKAHHDYDDVSPQRSSSPRPMSEAVKERFQEIRRAKQQSREIGKEALSYSSHKKELAEQVQALENRIKKLKQDEELIVRKIHETSHKTDKVVQIKKRRAGDLLLKAKHHERQELMLNSRKQEVQQERELLKKQINQSIKDDFQTKSDVANYVKQENKQIKMLRQQKLHQENEKNKELINRIRTFEKSSLQTRAAHERELKAELNKSFVEKINHDKEQAELLEKQLKELSQVEDQWVQRLNQTQSIHREKFEELERTFNIRVSSPELIAEAENKDAHPEAIRTSEPENKRETAGSKEEIKVIQSEISVSKTAEGIHQDPQLIQSSEIKKSPAVKEAKETEPPADIKQTTEKKEEPEKKEESEIKQISDVKKEIDEKIVSENKEPADTKETHETEHLTQSKETVATNEALNTQ